MILYFHPTSLSTDFTGRTDDVETGDKVKVCLHAFVCKTWKGLSYFWSLEERSRDGVWSQNRGSTLLHAKGGSWEERRGERSGKWRGRVRNSLLWMSCYPGPAGSLWLTVGLYWMSEVVTVKFSPYQLSGPTFEFVGIWRWNLYFAALDLWLNSIYIEYWKVKKNRNMYVDLIQIISQ